MGFSFEVGVFLGVILLFAATIVTAKSRITLKKTLTSKENPNTIPKFELAGVVVAAPQLDYLAEVWSLPQNKL